MSLSTTNVDVLIVGAGAAGLATAAALQRQTPGVKVVVVEASDKIGNSWATRYNRLRLHTPRTTSALPYKKWPAGTSYYPSKEEVRAYLNSYASDLKLDVRLRHYISSVSYNAATKEYQATAQVWTKDEDAIKDITTPPPSKAHDANQTFICQSVVLATGAEVVPFIPNLPGQDTFKGPIIHSSAYTDGKVFKGQNVLVVGFGNSAGEIALCLSECGAYPTLLVRKEKAVIIPKDDGLVSSLLMSIDHKKWLKPVLGLLDKVMDPIMHMQIPNLRPYGIPQVCPGYFGNKGVLQSINSEMDPPQMDVGQVAAICAGKIKVVRGELQGYTPRGALVSPRFIHPFSKGNSTPFGTPMEMEYDAIILCTGYDHCGSFRRILSSKLYSSMVRPTAPHGTHEKDSNGLWTPSSSVEQAKLGGEKVPSPSSTSSASSSNNGDAMAPATRKGMGAAGDRVRLSGGEVPDQPGLYILGYEDILGRLALIGQEAKAIASLIAKRVGSS